MDEKNRPAILGGEKAISSDYSYLRIIPEKEQIEAVVKSMQTSKLTTHTSSGPINELEQKFCRYHNSKFALSFCNGTSALLTSFFAINLSQEDEVIVPAYSYFASVMPIFHTRAIPIFCDVESETLCIDPIKVREKITSKTKAIVATTMTGLPPNLPALRKIADENSVFLIEDSARGIGGSIDGKLIGSFGDASCFSLNTVKAIPAGEGGMLITNSEMIFNRALALGHPVYKKPTLEEYVCFGDSAFGFKHSIHPLGASMANAIFNQLDKRVQQSNENYRKFIEMLQKFEFITPLIEKNDEIRGAWSGLSFFYKPESLGLSTQLFIDALKAEGCRLKEEYPSNILYSNPILDQANLFLRGYIPKGMDKNFPVSDRIKKNLIILEGICSYTLPVDSFIKGYELALNKVSKNVARIKEVKND